MYHTHSSCYSGLLKSKADKINCKSVTIENFLHFSNLSMLRLSVEFVNFNQLSENFPN